MGWGVRRYLYPDGADLRAALEVLGEVAQAMGCATTEEYLSTLALEGPAILKRLPGMAG